MSTVIVNVTILSNNSRVTIFDGINNLSDNNNSSNDHKMKSIESEIHNILENQKNNDDMDMFRNLFINLESY